MSSGAPACSYVSRVTHATGWNSYSHLLRDCRDHAVCRCIQPGLPQKAGKIYSGLAEPCVTMFKVVFDRVRSDTASGMRSRLHVSITCGWLWRRESENPTGDKSFLVSIVTQAVLLFVM